VEIIVIEDVPRPIPTTGELLVRVVAAGVGPWDALIREGKSKVSAQPPLTLGADLSGIVEELEIGIIGFNRGVEVYGVTNPAVLWRECRVCHGLGWHDRSQTKTIEPIWIGAVLNKDSRILHTSHALNEGRQKISRMKETIMKIVVIGGSGLIGSKLVNKLREHGHEAVAASPNSGVNTLTGEGLAEVLKGASVVVDVSNSPSWEDAAAGRKWLLPG